MCACVFVYLFHTAGLGLSDLDWAHRKEYCGCVNVSGLALMTGHIELRHPSLFLAVVFTIYPHEQPARVMRASGSIYDKTPHACFLEKDVSPTSQTTTMHF